MDIKNRVSQVRSYLEGIGQAVTAVQGHEVVARALGYKNTHTLAAASSWLEPATFTTLKLCFEASATAGYHSDDGANAVSWNLTPELWARVLAAQALFDILPALKDGASRRKSVVTNRLYFDQLPAPLGTSTAGFVTKVGDVLFDTSDRESVRSLAELLAPEALQALDNL